MRKEIHQGHALSIFPAICAPSNSKSARNRAVTIRIIYIYVNA